MKENRNFTLNKKLWPAVVLLALVVGAIWTNAGFVGFSPLQPAPPEKMTAPAEVPGPQGETWASPRTALQIQEGISRVVSMVRPAVVTILGHTASKLPGGNGLTYINPFLGRSGPIGSGLIVDRRGYVLTTYLTVGKANVVRVILFSGGRREYEADVIGVDPNTDLALLRIRAKEVFPAVILGNSDLLEVGDIVLAIGSPFGFAQTVTMGIVSSNRREVRIDGAKYPDMIQTDATINEGNDGGPLVNVRGEVVGVNVASYKLNNQYSGIGFAIPINDVLGFINSHAG